VAYAFSQDVPIDADIYRQIKDEIGEVVPAGLIVHVVTRTERGLRYLDVWDSQADWERFREQQVHPALERVLARIDFQRPAGDPPMQELEVVEVWKP
jgi:hypothetical protein